MRIRTPPRRPQDDHAPPITLPDDLSEESRTCAGTAAPPSLAAALVAALAAGPLAVPAFAASAAPVSGAPSSSAPSSSAPSSVRATSGPDAEALAAALAGLPDQDATAAQIRVGGDGRWLGTAGVRDLRTGAPALENGRFRAGSVTKVVTASIVLQLAAEGRIDLDGTVQQYLPGLLTEDFDPITVRQLLNYTSGLRPGASLGTPWRRATRTASRR